MRSLIIKGNRFLKGTVTIDGAKNAAIPLLAASLLVKGKVVFRNVPNISDVLDMIDILKKLDCKVIFKGSSVYVDNANLKYKPLVFDCVKRIRGSYYLIGVFLTLFSKCEILLPGGCKIGSRPIDLHLKAFSDLGYKWKIEDGILLINKAKDIDNIVLSIDKKSVGASINAMLAAVGLNSVWINNCLFEPEGLDVIKFLKEIGYDINLINNKLRINRKKLEFKVIKHKIIPDRIEAMTYVVIGLLNGYLKIKNVYTKDLEYPIKLLKKAGYLINYSDTEIEVYKSIGGPINFKTEEYPGFPTDLQSIFGVLALFSIGESVIEERIFESRLKLYYDLVERGLDINITENVVKIKGVERLEGFNMTASDLRHGAALICLALKCDGVSEVNNFEIVNRGYSNIINKLRICGADIKEK